MREWMPNRFAVIGDRITNYFDAQVLIFGGPNEGELVNHVARLMAARATTFSAHLPIRQFSALIESCNLFITNDTGAHAHFRGDAHSNGRDGLDRAIISVFSR